MLFNIPRRCLLCDFPAEKLNICSLCLADLPKLGQVCRLCALSTTTIGSSICGSCLQQPPPWQTLRSLLPYQAPIDVLVKRLKFGREINIAHTLGQLMGDYLCSFTQNKVDLIVPVPLHPLRQWRRGFNQSYEIAKPISRKLNIPLHTSLCKRRKRTHEQAKLTYTQRAVNVDHAFQCTKANLKNQHIAIVDDVLTTGATASSLSRCLIESKAIVSVWVIARTQASKITPDNSN